MPDDANAERREALIRRCCSLMGWDYETAPVWAGLRKVAVAEAVVVGLDKFQALLGEIERLRAIVEHYGHDVNGIDC